MTHTVYMNEEKVTHTVYMICTKKSLGHIYQDRFNRLRKMPILRRSVVVAIGGIDAFSVPARLQPLRPAHSPNAT